MRDILTVMKFTMKEMVKRKSYVISTLIILILIVIGFNVPNIIKSIKGDASNEEKILIVDNENIFDGGLEALKSMNTDYKIEIEKNSYDEIKNKIENDEIDSAIIVESKDDNVKIRYIVENTNMMNKVPEDIVTTINGMYSAIQINKLGLTDEQLKSISPNFEFSLEQTSEKKAEGNVLVIMLLSIVLFYAIYL